MTLDDRERRVDVRRPQSATTDVGDDELTVVDEVRRCQIMACFVDQHHQLEIDTLTHGKPALSTGVMWSLRLVPVISRAAAFCTDCRRQNRLSVMPQNSELLFGQYDSVLRDIADGLAPPHAIRRPASRLAPWFDTSCRNARRQCDSRYRRTRTTEDRCLWVDAARSRFHGSTEQSGRRNWLEQLSQHGRSPTSLWRSLSSMLDRDCDTSGSGTTGHTADDFAASFRQKVNGVMAATAGQTDVPVVDHPPPGKSARGLNYLQAHGATRHDPRGAIL